MPAHVQDGYSQFTCPDHPFRRRPPSAVCISLGSGQLRHEMVLFGRFSCPRLHPPRRNSPVRIHSMAENEAGSKPVESFETCLDELEKVVKQLEAGDLPLDRALELFERGVNLSDTCRKQLEEAETRVEMLIRTE